MTTNVGIWTDSHLLNLDDNFLLFLSEGCLPSCLGLLHDPLSLFKYGGDLGRPGEDRLVEGEVGGGEGVDFQEIRHSFQAGL